jgi:hypothetical protein
MYKCTGYGDYEKHVNYVQKPTNAKKNTEAVGGEEQQQQQNSQQANQKVSLQQHLSSHCFYFYALRNRNYNKEMMSTRGNPLTTQFCIFLLLLLFPLY